MGLFNWLGEKARLRKQLAELEAENANLHAALTKLRDDNIAATKALCTTLANLNVSMQAGECWIEVFNAHLNMLPPPDQAMVRAATLQVLHKWYIDGVEVNMNQHPAFEFPTPRELPHD